MVPLAAAPSVITENRVALQITQLDARERIGDAQALFHDLNSTRANSGLAPLAFDERLSAVARAHALDMVRHGYFGHVSLDGESPFDRMKRAGYPFGYAGENLAFDADERSANRALFNSIEHRDNMLEPHYVYVGIAAVNTDQGEFFVEDFAD